MAGDVVLRKPKRPSKKMQAKIELLRNHFLLNQLSEASLRQISSDAMLDSFESGHSIFFQGDRKTDLMIVVSGRVKLVATSLDGKELLANIAEAGQILGEIAVIDGQPRTFSAIALAPTVLLTVRRENLIPFLKKRPEVCIRWMAILCDRLRRSERLVQETIFLSVKSRLARQLIRLAKTHGHEEGKNTVIELRLSQRDLADLAGVTRESVNKQLCVWRRQSILGFRGKQYKILNLPALVKEADRI